MVSLFNTVLKTLFSLADKWSDSAHLRMYTLDVVSKYNAVILTPFASAGIGVGHCNSDCENLEKENEH